MKIAHISDLHIRLASRHDEYKDVFDSLIRDLKEKSPDLIVNTGDTVHNKVHLSPEVFSMMRYLYSQLVEIAPNVIIDGNHDLILHNNFRMSSIKSFVDLFNDQRSKDKKIIYLEGSGVHDVSDGVRFFHYPLIGNEYPDLSMIDKSLINIALYHGVVGGAKTDVGHTFKKEEQKIDIPHEEFDAVMLGDIHKQQFLQDNMAYSSSLIQQNWGEAPNNHGYILWSFDNNRLSGSEFVEIENDRGMYKLSYSGGTLISQFPTLPKRAKVKVIYDGDSILEEVKSSVKEQFGVDDIILEEKLYDSDGNEIDVKDDIVNVHNYDVQRSIVSDYFEGDDHKKELLELNERLFDENKYKFDMESKRISWVPEFFEFSNLFVYGEDNKFVFDDKKGVIGLFSPNTSGKSSLLDAIQFAIYGETARTSTYDDIVNKQSKDYSSHIYILVGANKRITIQRSGKRGTSTWNNSICVNEYDSSGELVNSETNISEAKKIIDKYFGDAKSYQKTSYIYQDSDERFLNLTPTKRKEWLYDNLGLEVFEILHTSAKSESKDLKNTIDYLENQSIKNKINNALDERVKIQTQLDTLENIKMKRLQDEKDNKESEIQLLESRRFKIDETLVDVSDKMKQIKDNILSLSVKNDHDKESISNDRMDPPHLIGKHDQIASELQSLEKDGYDVKSEAEKNKELEIENVLTQGSQTSEKISTLEKNLLSDDQLEKKKSYLSDLEKDKKTLQESLQDKRVKQSQLETLRNTAIRTKKQFSVLEDDERFTEEDLCKTCPLLSSAFESKEEYNELVKKGKLVAEEIENIKVSEGDVDLIDEKIEKVRDEISQQSTIVGNLESIREKRKDLLDRHSLLKDDLKNIRSQKKELYDSKIKNLQDNLDSVKKEIASFHQSEVERLKSDIKLREVEIRSLAEKLESLKNDQKKYESQIVRIEENKKLDVNIRQIKDRLVDLSSSISEVQSEIIECKSNIKSINDRISEYETQYEELKKAKSDYIIYEKYIRATHKNNIPLRVISNMLDVIEKEINTTLSNVVDFKLKVFVEDDNVVCNIIDSRGEREASRLSGMERFVSNLAFRISIAQIGNMSVSKMLLIDEGLSALDSTTSQDIPILFSYLKTKFENIFVVSHHESMRDMVDFNVEIDTSNKKSKIVA